MGGPATVNPPAMSSAPATSSQPAGPSLKKQWDLTDPPPLDNGTNEKAKKFVGDFKAAMEPVKQCLLYTKVNAEKPKHDAMINKRDPLYAEFPSKLGEVNKDESKADSISKPILDRARALGGEATKLKQETEKSLKAWQAKEPAYTKSQQETDDLEKWGDKEFPNLRKAGDEIRSATNENKYDEGVKLLDQHLAKLKPVYDEYVKQKAAKEKYDAEFKKIESQLPKASETTSAKLAPAQAEIADVQKQMEAAAQAKDYVKALDLVGNLSGKVTAYTAQAAELEKHKQAYEKTLQAIKPRLAEVPKSTYQKLAKQKEEIITAQGQMEAAAKAGDYAEADRLVSQMGAKLDALETARADLEKQKKEYDEAKKELEPKLKGAQQTDENPKLAPMTKQIATTQGQIEENAKKEEFHQAAELTKQLSKLIDEYKKTKAGSIYEIEYPEKSGQKFKGTAEELAALRMAIAAHAAKVLAPVTHQAEYNEGYYKDLRALYNDFIILADIVNAAGGAKIDSIPPHLAKQKPALEKAEKAISITDNARNAKTEFDNARKATNEASQAINAYLGALEKGGERTITVLETVEVVCFAVGAAAGAAVLAPVAGAGLANFAAGAGFGALQSIAENTAQNAIMDQKKLSMGEIGTNALISGAANGAGNWAGGAGGKKAGELVFKQMAVKYGIKSQLGLRIVREAVDGGLGNAIQQVFASGADAGRGKWKGWPDFVSALLKAFVVGGIGKVIAGKATRNSQACQNLSKEEFEALQKELAPLTGP